jgi:hypothetical protein
MESAELQIDYDKVFAAGTVTLSKNISGQSEQRIQLANTERLKSAGIAIGTENSASLESPGLRVEQSEYSFLTANVKGGFAAAICLTLTPLKSGIILRDCCEITMPGCDDLNVLVVQPSKDPRLYTSVFRYFKLESDAVLNPHFLNGRALPRRQVLDGILLVYSYESLPGRLMHRMTMHGTISLTDQLDNVYETDLQLIVEPHVPRKVKEPKARSSMLAPTSPQSTSVWGAIVGGSDRKKGGDVIDT